MWKGKKANSQEKKEAMSQALVGRPWRGGVQEGGRGLGMGRGLEEGGWDLGMGWGLEGGGHDLGKEVGLGGGAVAWRMEGRA